MNVTAEAHGHAVVMNLKGDLTEDSLNVLRNAVDQQFQHEDVIDVLINLEEVSFIDSTALEYLLDLQDRLAEKLGQVKLIAPDDNVRTILNVTRLAGSFETFEDAARAMQVIQAQ